MTAISNSGATAHASSFEICQRTGRKVKAGTLVKEWTNLWVMPEVLDIRSQQDFVRGQSELLTGSIRPESTDTFLAVNDVLAADL